MVDGSRDVLCGSEIYFMVRCGSFSYLMIGCSSIFSFFATDEIGKNFLPTKKEKSFLFVDSSVSRRTFRFF